ncbi:MAG: hypothetical protein IJ134_04120 [Bacilli bacterium]|nr:hypothetical protein [Bacilli bacterium]
MDNTQSKWVEKYIESQKINDEIINEISSKPNYINWVIDYTKDKETFYSDDYMWYSNSLDETSKKNIKNLSLFYEAIYEYASKNHIYPNLDKFGNNYKIKYNNNEFEIGFMAGQGTIFYCKKETITDNSIDYNDIINNKKQENVDFINNSLKTLSEKIIYAYENGVPIEAIKETLQETINDISKTLVKKNNK